MGAFDLIPLGRVYLRKDGPRDDEWPYVEWLKRRIEREFDDEELTVYGRDRPGPLKPVPSQICKIDWVGDQTRTDDAYPVSVGASDSSYAPHSYVDLAIREMDWNRINREWSTALSNPQTKKHTLGGRPIQPLPEAGVCAGRLSLSWHLIEVEVRRRWTEGVRHPSKKSASGEHVAQWAAEMSAWFDSDASTQGYAKPRRNTFTNKLSSLLRELSDCSDT